MNRTVLRSAQMMKFVAKNKDGVTLQTIAEHLEVPKSSAFVILQTLLELNFIVPSRYNDKKYRLGLEAFTLGMQYVNDLDVVSQCAQQLDPLADKYGKTGFVGVLSGRSIVYIHKYVADGVRLASCDLGSRKRAHITALGKAIMANLSKELLCELLEKIDFEPATENSITSRERLETQLTETKKKGYSLDDRENDTMLSCCAAPIFDYTGKVVAAISLSDLYREGEDVEQMALELKIAAEKISIQLGYFS
ncbi:MAG: IclR family transcriptional regulator [Bacillota bacterium]